MLDTTAVGIVADTEWQVAHAALLSLAQERAGLDLQEGRWLLVARRANAHRQMGYGSFSEYVERLFGYAPRVTHDKLRVAAALESLPELARALGEGSLSFSQVRELTRVATPETEGIWLERAKGCTSRQVEKLVAGRRPGALPDAPAEPELMRHVLRFEVSGQTLAMFREALTRLRRDAGEHLDDDAALLLLARHVLGGTTDDGRSSYQVALDVCEDCGRGRQLADGELVSVSPAVTEMAMCDAQRVPVGHAANDPDDAQGAHGGRDARGAHVGRDARGAHVGRDARCAHDGRDARGAHGGRDARGAHAAHVGDASPVLTEDTARSDYAGKVAQRGRGSRGAQDVALAVRSSVLRRQAAHAAHAAHVGDPSQLLNADTRRSGGTSRVAQGGRGARATQEVAPAVRRSVLRRDRHRCQVPGCRHATFVDIHHIKARASGGSHDASNLITLCGAHHTAVHEGTLVLSGSVASGLEFRHADGMPYGGRPAPPDAWVQARALRALRGLGFGEREAREALHRTQHEVAPTADLETTLRSALSSLTARALARPA